MTISFVSAAVVLIVLAIAKARIAGLGVTGNVVEVALCAASAAIGYLVGWAAENRIG